VAARYVEPGAVAGPGRPVLRLVGESDPQVRFAVPAEVANQLMVVGGDLRVQLSSPHVVLSGVVDHVAPEVDNGSHMLFAVGKVKVPPAVAARLTSGIVARVSLSPTARVEAADGGAVLSFEPDPLM
jgi:hypothetical protein